MRLAVDQILISDKTRVRAKIDQKVVDDFARDMKNGAVFPAVTVFCEKNSQRYYMADGEHRVLACIQNNKKTVGVEVKEGGQHEAFEYALSANTTHGMRRTSADKRHAVTLALDDPYYDEWSQRQVSELCRVSHTMVRSIFDARMVEESSTDAKGHKRPRKPKPTQAEVDLKQLREIQAGIKEFPYSGEGLAKRLGLNPDDEKDLEYCMQWFKEALASCVRAKK